MMPNTSDNEFPLFDECKRLYDLSRQLIDSEDIFAQYKAEHPNYHEEDLEYIKLKENVLLNKHQIKTCIFTILRLVAQNYQFQKIQHTGMRIGIECVELYSGWYMIVRGY